MLNRWGEVGQSSRDFGGLTLKKTWRRGCLHPRGAVSPLNQGWGPMQAGILRWKGIYKLVKLRCCGRGCATEQQRQERGDVRCGSPTRNSAKAVDRLH